MATRKAAKKSAKKSTKKATKKAAKKPAAKTSAKKTSARKSAAKKTYPTKSGKRSTTPPSKRWSSKVTTDSTHPPQGLFKQSGKKIAAVLARKSVSPKGPGQAMQMLTFYENRAGKNLSSERLHALEAAKHILHEEVEESHHESGSESSRSKN